MTDMKGHLIEYLRAGRAALLWKLEGASEYDARRPLTPTGTNLLGMVKHVASVEAGYLGDCFGRPFGESFPWFADDAEPNADLWATAGQTREEIVSLYHRVAAHSEATIGELALDATGEVPWWPAQRRRVTLHQIALHVLAETHRHAGHADLVRELIDGSIGMMLGRENLPEGDDRWWAGYHDRLEQVARAFRD